MYDSNQPLGACTTCGCDTILIRPEIRADQIRNIISEVGIPVLFEQDGNSNTESIRMTAYKFILGISMLSASKYIGYVKRGACHVQSSIDQDVHRTFSSDKQFSMRVPQKLIIRLLTAFAHACEDTKRQVSDHSTKRTILSDMGAVVGSSPQGWLR